MKAPELAATFVVMSAKLSACALVLASSLLGCSNDQAPAELAKAELPALPGAGFSATTRAELAKAGGPPLSAKAVEAARSAEAKPAPATKPADPAAKPADPAAKPADPAAKPADPATKPADPAAKPTDPAAKPADPAAKPADPVAKPADPVAKPADPAAKPADPAAKPADPAAKPADPVAKPADPAAKPAPTASPATSATVSSELAAIKLTLPNEGWLRDSVAPGTFSFFTIGAGGKNIRYVFTYAYEDVTAPLEREAYTAWLGSKKILKVTVDRQRGAAWYLEGADRSGEASFRYVINYGGRLITCGGSLHKQGPGAALRDHRDEIIKQAKAICENLTL